MRLLLTCLLLAFGFNTRAQSITSNLSIDIIGHPSMGNKFNVYVHSNDSSIKVIVRRADSISKKGLTPEDVKPLLDSFTVASNTKDDSMCRNISDRLTKLIEKHTYYSSDSVTVNKKSNISYNLLLDSIVTIPEETLTQMPKNQVRLVLDGIRFQIIMKINERVIKDFWVHSPDSQHEPLIRRLISETLGIYRTNRPGSSISKTYTHGY